MAWDALISDSDHRVSDRRKISPIDRVGAARLTGRNHLLISERILTPLGRPVLAAATVLLLIAAARTGDRLDEFGGWTGLQGERTGFFHLEEISGRHWFVSPEGNVFFPVSMSHLLSGESYTAATRLFGDDKEAWIRDSLEKARAMGFNCALGGATSPERNLNGFVDLDLAESIFREEKFPYAVGVILMKHPWEFVEGETLPDIFDPSYKQLIESRAEAVCPTVKDDPLMIGYYYGFGAFNRSQQWVNHHLSLPPGSAGREELVDLLADRHGGGVREFNRVYGTSLKAIEELKGKEVLAYPKEFERANYPSVGRNLDPVQMADFQAILSHMAVTLYRIAHTAVRRWDTNHLILGSFIKEWALTGASWKEAAPYLDMIAPQHVNPEIPINALADAAGLPMIVSDEETGFHYPGNRGNLYRGVRSHRARGEIYSANLMRHYKDSQVVGVTFCTCMYDQDGESLKKNKQGGYYDMDGNPRQDLIDMVSRINREVYAHTPHAGTPEEIRALERTLFGLWDRHRQRRNRVPAAQDSRQQ